MYKFTLALAVCLHASAQAVMEADPGLPTHTIYRPEKITGKLPIVVWGNGACANLGNRFQYFLTEIAAHGYLAIAIGPIGPPEAARPPQPTTATPPRPPAGPPATKASQLIDAVDWAIAENSRAGSKFKGKLDTKKIAVMGQSCGGVQAIKASADPRVSFRRWPSRRRR